MGETPRSKSPGRRMLAVLVAALFATTLFAGCTHETLLGGKGQPGGWAVEFLSDEDFSSLLVEIDHESGAAPRKQALDALESTLETYLKKPDGITIRQSQISAKGSGAKYSFDEIRDLEDSVRDNTKGDGRAVLHILYLDGGSTEDSDQGSVLGAAYTGSSIVMFRDNIDKTRNRCPLGLGCPAAGEIEHAVMVHELGHILGLVNNGIPMQTNHEDPDHPGHSSNKDSVMYWKVETGNILDLLSGNGIPKTFDANDKADMRAAGGK